MEHQIHTALSLKQENEFPSEPPFHPTDSSFQQERMHEFHQISEAPLSFYFPTVPAVCSQIKI